MKRATALVLALSGCSFVFQKPPPPVAPPHARFPFCQRHYAEQMIDGTIALLATTATIYLAARGDTLGAVVEGGVAVGFGVSALATITWPGRCRRAQDAYENASADRYWH